MDLANRHIEPNVRLPIVPAAGTGIVTPSCDDRTRYAIPIRAGVGLRIGGEARLCFDCGPEGSVYHPADASLEDVIRKAGELTTATGYDPADLTPAVMAGYEDDMRRAFAPKYLPCPKCGATDRVCEIDGGCPQ